MALSRMNPIPFSHADLERRQLEYTLDNDLASISLGTLTSISTATATARPQTLPDLSSLGSVEYPRGEGRSISLDAAAHHFAGSGPHGTPRAAAPRRPTHAKGTYGESPVSTAGHHVSAVTLADGIFRRHRDEDDDSEFDPERSLGRLVGELGRVMSGRISPRPTSPFSPPRSPRSPSPLTTSAHNLSFTLNRSTALPSPPTSRSSSEEPASGFTAAAQKLEKDLRAKSAPRRALSDTTAHNIVTPAPRRAKGRLEGLKENVRPKSAPTPAGGDITGMTGLLETPAKGAEYGTLGRNADIGGDPAGTVPHTLATLQARLRALETENSLSRRRVRELEHELERAKGEVDTARHGGDRRLRDVIGEKTALEDLVNSLRSHLARLTVELEQNKALVAELRNAQTGASAAASTRATHDADVKAELSELRRAVERLSKEIQRLSGIVEEGLETRKKARGEKTLRLEAEEAERLARELDLQRAKQDVERRQQALDVEVETITAPSKLREGLRVAAAPKPSMRPAGKAPTAKRVDLQEMRSPTPPSRPSSRRRSRVAEGPASPFPSIREDDEPEFFALRPDPATDLPATRPPSCPNLIDIAGPSSGEPVVPQSRKFNLPESVRNMVERKGEVPPQTVLARVVREIEADFAHYRAIYSELADQYKILDPASHVAKRHVLAEHLKEVIDTLEQKADQIAALYDLLSFQDRPSSTVSGEGGPVRKSVPDIMRMVRESLGEEGLKRLEKDGLRIPSPMPLL